jgi:hypothetical protein
MVAQDVPLFLSLLQDLFTNTPSPPKGEYPALEAALKVPTVCGDSRFLNIYAVACTCTIYNM